MPVIAITWPLMAVEEMPWALSHRTHSEEPGTAAIVMGTWGTEAETIKATKHTGINLEKNI